MGTTSDGSMLRILYLRNTGKVIKARGLSLIPKVKYEHIYLTSFSKIQVDLAAQVIHLQIYD